MQYCSCSRAAIAACCAVALLHTPADLDLRFLASNIVLTDYTVFVFAHVTHLDCWSCPGPLIRDFSILTSMLYYMQRCYRRAA